MHCVLAIIGFAAFSATALMAQQHDMDKMQGGGTLPAGWYGPSRQRRHKARRRAP